MKKLIAILAMVGVLAMAGAAQAAPITVDNHSFETYGEYEEGGYYDPANWTTVETDRSEFHVADWGAPDDGLMHIWMFSGVGWTAHMWQTPLTVGEGGVQANTVYTFTFAFKNVDLNTSTFSAYFTLGTDDYDLSQAVGNVFSKTGSQFTTSYVDYSTTLDSSTLAPGDIGKRLNLVFQFNQTKYAKTAYFDNVRLDGAAISGPVPEPASLGLIGLALLAVRKRR